MCEYLKSVGVVAFGTGSRTASGGDDEAPISSLHRDLAVDVHADMPGGVAPDNNVTATGVCGEGVRNALNTKPNSVTGVGTGHTSSSTVR